MTGAFEIPGAAGASLAAVGYAAGDAAPLLVLAHGAGAGQQSAFLVEFAQAMISRGIGVVTFDFPYMRRGARAPDRPAVLEETWRIVLRHVLGERPEAAGRVVIGGKSMGGRIASQVLAAPIPAAGDDAARDLRVHVAGLVLLGYPLHPPNQPARLRTAHLPALATPTLVVQGERDEFGTEHEVRQAFAVVPAHVDWLIVPGGDHSFRARGARRAAELTPVHEGVAAWIAAHVAAARALG